MITCPVPGCGKTMEGSTSQQLSGLVVHIRDNHRDVDPEDLKQRIKALIDRILQPAA